MAKPDVWTGWSWILQVFVLWALAVAQPIYDLLGRYPEFFVARRTVPLELVQLTFGLSLLGPVVIAAGLLVLRLRWEKLFRWAWLGLVASLSTLALLPVAKRLPVPALLGAAAALAAGLLLAWIYPRARALRLFLSYLAPVVVVFPAYFLVFTPVEKLAFPGQPPPVPARQAVDGTGQPPSVVMVVFDELALFSLLDKEGRIDRNRFPHFADLAAESTWFRHATTVAESTHSAIPAIATGLYPTAGKLGNSADYPDNLFTWLSGTHRLQVFESITQLCPVQLCSPRIEAPWTTRTRLLGEDLLVVYGHLVLPDRLSLYLPSIDQGWGNFRRKAWQLQRSLAFYAGGPGSFEQLLQALEESKEPSLFFYHFSLPHFPWVFLPSGRRYSTQNLGRVFLNRDRWVQDLPVVMHGFQRYYLQLGFTDRQLGRLLDKLEKTGMDQHTVLVVLADHGVSFIPGQPRRAANTVTAAEIMPIPLFLRMPGQKEARVSDQNLETVDVLPTLSEALGIPLPWKVDGQSIWSRPRNKPRKLLYKQGRERPFEFSPDLSERTAPAICLQGDLLETDTGQVVGSIDNVVIDGDRVVIAGFASDLSNSQPADRILVFVDDVLVHTATPNDDRPDVVEFFDKPGLLMSGFLLRLKRSSIPDAGDTVVRFFGQRGRALSELTYHANYPWKYESDRRENAAVAAESICGDPTRSGFLVPRARVRVGDSPELRRFRANLERLALSTGPDGLFKAVPGSQLLDRPVSDLPPAARPLQVRLRDAAAFKNVDLKGDFVPAEVDATFAREDVPGRSLVAVTLNGVVRAVAKPFAYQDQGRILTVLPEGHFRAGSNQIDFYSVPQGTLSTTGGR